MKFTRLKNNFEDDRGIIRDILTQVKFDAATIITSAKGATRANHFHKDTIQWTYILKGKVQYLYQKEGEDTKEVLLEEGDVVRSDVKEAHALTALEDSSLLILTRGPRNGEEYESDTFRLDTPLSLSK
ncbi:MAG: cupin domain-containing protein [SAR324 cluster bacterium]|nr:cupin domain-containing protein [SAR324 cluster bacterium]